MRKNSLSGKTYEILGNGKAMTITEIAALIPGARANSVSTAVWILKGNGSVVKVGSLGQSGLYVRADKLNGKAPEWFCRQRRRDNREVRAETKRVAVPNTRPDANQRIAKPGATGFGFLRKEKIQLLDRLIARTCGDAADLLMNIRDDYRSLG